MRRQNSSGVTIRHIGLVSLLAALSTGCAPSVIKLERKTKLKFTDARGAVGDGLKAIEVARKPSAEDPDVQRRSVRLEQDGQQIAHTLEKNEFSKKSLRKLRKRSGEYAEAFAQLVLDVLVSQDGYELAEGSAALRTIRQSRQNVSRYIVQFHQDLDVEISNERLALQKRIYSSVNLVGAVLQGYDAAYKESLDERLRRVRNEPRKFEAKLEDAQKKIRELESLMLDVLESVRVQLNKMIATSLDDWAKFAEELNERIAEMTKDKAEVVGLRDFSTWSESFVVAFTGFMDELTPQAEDLGEDAAWLWKEIIARLEELIQELKGSFETRTWPSASVD